MPSSLTITTFPSHLTIDNIDDGSRDKLVDAFSYHDKNAIFKMRNHQKKHPKKLSWCFACQWTEYQSLLDGNKLPIGFRDRLLNLLDEWGESYELNDQSGVEPEKQYDWHYDRELRPYQEEIMAALLGNRSGVVDASVASGKTVIAASLVCELGVPTIILTPGTVVFQQFWEEFTEHSDIPVGMIGGGKYQDAPVQIAICKSLIGKERVAKTQYLEGKQLLIVDEVHMAASESWSKIVEACPAYYRFGFSGTPYRKTDLESNFLSGLTGEVLAKITTSELQADGWLPDSDIRVIQAPCSYDRSKQDEKGEWVDTTYSDRYRQGIVKNFGANLMISEVVHHHVSLGHKVLVIVAWTDHGDILFDMFPDDTVYLTGRDGQKKTKEKRDQFASMTCGVLLGSPKIDCGFDVPELDMCFMAGGGEYPGRQIQRLGRGLRPSPGKNKVTIYDLIHDDRNTGGRPTFYQHSQARIKAYQSVGQAVTEYDSVEAALATELTLGV